MTEKKFNMTTFRTTTKSEVEERYKGINLYLKREENGISRTPPEPVVNTGFFLGVKHSCHDYYLKIGDVIPGKKVFLYTVSLEWGNIILHQSMRMFTYAIRSPSIKPILLEVYLSLC